MPNDPTSSFSHSFEYHTPPEERTTSQNGHHPHAMHVIKLRQLVDEYMTILQEAELDEDALPHEDQSILQRNDSYLLMTFAGVLTDKSEATYDELDKRLREWDMYPLLRLNQDSDEKPHVIHVLVGRPEKPEPMSPWLNILLLLATIVSVLLTGTTIAAGQIGLEDPQQGQIIMSSVENILREMWRGYPYALAILAILGTHEMGHYLMMRRHKAAATLPYFIPAFLVSPFGTFGAAIMLRETLKNRKTLLDVGAWGPVAGFIVAVPILFIGLATSTVTTIVEGGFVEGNSLLYVFAKWIVFGEVLPNGDVDVMINQLAWAGWTGLFVTALNMIPLGQLDGGHVLYSLLGDRARRLYYPLLGVMILLLLFVSPMWLVFIVLLFFVGRVYAMPLDNITPLDRGRKWLGIAALVIFVLSFTPVPLYEQGTSGGLLTGFEDAALLGSVGVALLVTLPRWLRR
jgi:Zn-dependent protease